MTKTLTLEPVVSTGEQQVVFKEIADDVKARITSQPRTLHPALCYDPEGSELFEKLCKQPEYYLTRTEKALLFREGASLITLVQPTDIIDLGCGNLEKTKILVHEAIKYSYISLHLCDIDGSVIDRGITTTIDYYKDYVNVNKMVCHFEQCINLFVENQRRKLFSFLGSTYGNLSVSDRSSLINTLSVVMQPNDFFLLGIDLVKDVETLEAAYNDSGNCQHQSVMQMLHNLNQVYRAEFQIDAFDHVSRYEPARRCVVSYIVSKKQQQVRIKDLGVTLNLAEGEEIEAEMREKFILTEVLDFIQNFGLRPVTIAVDNEMPYALLLFSGPRRP